MAQHRLHAGQLKLALRQYQIEQGRPADALALLVPRYLPAIPLDPFDGQPFRYRLSRGEFIVWPPPEPDPPEPPPADNPAQGEGVAAPVPPEAPAVGPGPPPFGGDGPAGGMGQPGEILGQLPVVA